MEEKVWSVEERFGFPSIGNAIESKMIRVTPQWQMIHDDSSVRLLGVYHIASNLVFELGETNHFDEDNVMIDDVDLEGLTGYFEYAVPFTIDLPDDASIPQLDIQNVQTLFENGCCKIGWDVSCSYKKLEPVTSFTQKVDVEDIRPVDHVMNEELELSEQDALHSITSAPMIWDLIDRYSVTEFKLNQIVRK